MQDVYPLPRFCFYPGGAGVRVTSAEELAALPPGWSSVPDGPFTEGMTVAPLPAPSPPLTLRQQVYALSLEGLTHGAIARQVGLTTDQVWHHIRTARKAAHADHP